MKNQLLHTPEGVRDIYNKECARKHPVKVDYSGFIIEDYFVVGYGLDYGGYYRNLPYVGYFS